MTVKIATDSHQHILQETIMKIELLQCLIFLMTKVHFMIRGSHLSVHMPSNNDRNLSNTHREKKHLPIDVNYNKSYIEGTCLKII